MKLKYSLAKKAFHKSRYFKYILLPFFLISCSSDYSPKPRGYFRIELPDPAYHDFDRSPFFRCSVSNQAQVEEWKDETSAIRKKNEIGFILNYSRYRAKIYCTYYRILPADFPSLSDESRRMAYQIEKKAKGVVETAYSRPNQNVYGQMYEIQGNAVCPIQFAVSDSTSSFFRGALYFDSSFNRDSIAPALDYINRDIHVLIESLQWRQ